MDSGLHSSLGNTRLSSSSLKITTEKNTRGQSACTGSYASRIIKIVSFRGKMLSRGISLQWRNIRASHNISGVLNRFLWSQTRFIVLFYMDVSQGLGTTEFPNLIG